MDMRACTVSRRKLTLLFSVVVFLFFLLYVFEHESNETKWKSDSVWKYRYRENELQQAIYKSSSSSLSDAPIIHIFIPSPSNQIIGMMALVNSINLNTNAKLKFHLLTDTQAGANHITAWMANSSTLCNIDKEVIVFNSSWIAGKFKVPYWESRQSAFSQALPYARYFIPWFLPPEFSGRAVYMDDDIIVQGDIRDLAWTRMGEHHFAALSPDCNAVSRAYHLKTVTYSSYVNFKNSHLKQIKIPHEACKLNSGVIVADVGKWKKWNITEKLLYWTELNKEEVVYYFDADQGVIMIVFFGRYSEYNPLWHVRDLGWSNGDKYDPKFLYNQAQLLHWNGNRKPWLYPKRQASDIWRKYYVPDESGL